MESIANELAILFRAGRDYLRCAGFYRLAAHHAATMFASQEAVALATPRAGRREARAGIVRAQPRGTGAADPAGELPNRDGGLCGPGSLARYCCWRGDYQNGLEHAEAAIALARDQGLALWKGWGAMLLARALAGLGRVGDIECDVRHAYNASVSNGAGLFRTYFLSILAEVHSVRCWSEQCATDVEEALEPAERNEERFWSAELYRLRGEIVLRSGGAAEDAARVFSRALDTACGQDLNSLRLRAALSMGRTVNKVENESAASAFAFDASSSDLDEARRILGKALRLRI